MKKLLFLWVTLALSSALAQPGAAASKGRTDVTWWGHAAFIIHTPGGATLAVDPWLHNPKAPPNAPLPQALDAILVTHGHFDHVGDTIALQKSTHAPVVGAFELVTLLQPGQSHAGNVGGSFRVKDATIHLVPAVHSSGYGPMDAKELKYGGPAMGFVIAIDNGPVLYHAGDTALFGDMALIAERFKPTYALLPIGGMFTMDPAAAAAATKLLKVKTVIPMHFGTFPGLDGTPQQLSSALKAAGSSAKVLELKPGQTVHL